MGGYFYAVDDAYDVINDGIEGTANPGASTLTTTTASSTNFFGWVDDSGTPFTSLQITSTKWYVALDDLILGQAAPAPVPGPLPLLGAAAAFRVSRRLRSRIAAARPRD